MLQRLQPAQCLHSWSGGSRQPGQFGVRPLLGFTFRGGRSSLAVRPQLFLVQLPLLAVPPPSRHEQPASPPSIGSSGPHGLLPQRWILSLRGAGRCRRRCRRWNGRPPPSPTAGASASAASAQPHPAAIVTNVPVSSLQSSALFR